MSEPQDEHRAELLVSPDLALSRLPSGPDLFDDAPLPYVVTDLKGVIVRANRAAGVLLGRPPVELPGGPIAAFAGPPPGALRRLVAAAGGSVHPRSAALALRPPRRSLRQVRVTVQRHLAPAGGDVLLWQVHPSATAQPLPPVVDTTDAASPPSLRSLAEQIRTAAGTASLPPEREALIEAVLELSSMLVRETDVVDALTGVASAALRGVTEAEGSSVTLLEPPSLGATDDRVERADRAQYDEEQGPCVTAMAERRTIVSGDVAADGRWPVAGPRVTAESGFRSLLAIPLLDRDRALGVLNLYAAPPRRFGAGSIAAAEVFAVPAAVRLANVQAYRASLHVADELRRGLVSRAVIDQAKGILMAQHGLEADQAFAVLTRFSQQENRKLRDVATDLVERSVRTGRRRYAARSERCSEG
jgi:GAF domain-containing protein